VLNLGDSRIISVHANTARQIVQDPHFHGDVQVIYLDWEVPNMQSAPTWKAPCKLLTLSVITVNKGCLGCGIV
jgi:hypothetical protein